MQLALRVNDFLVGLFLGIGIRLVDFKVEFGRLWDNEQMRIVLADEISPDLLPPVGHLVGRQARQGPLPARPRRRARSLPGSGAPPWRADGKPAAQGHGARSGGLQPDRQAELRHFNHPILLQRDGVISISGPGSLGLLAA